MSRKTMYKYFIYISGIKLKISNSKWKKITVFVTSVENISNERSDKKTDYHGKLQWNYVHHSKTIIPHSIIINIPLLYITKYNLVMYTLCYMLYIIYMY